MRASREGGNNHDAELVTFHRLHDFRSLALDIRKNLPPKKSQFSERIEKMIKAVLPE